MLAQHKLAATGAGLNVRILGPRGHRRYSQLGDVSAVCCYQQVRKDGGGGEQVEAAESQKQHL